MPNWRTPIERFELSLVLLLARAGNRLIFFVFMLGSTTGRDYQN
jgi:hypothetical protein